MGDDQQAPLTGPDLREQGVALADVADGGMLLGHALGKSVLLARRGDDVFAIGATCTHYGGPLAEGIITDGKVHCPWHHACFDLDTGKPGGPAITPLACWDVELTGGKIRVGKKREVPVAAVVGPSRVVIVGGGAAGVACAEALRLEGHTGQITIVSAEGTDPVDRPNLIPRLIFADIFEVHPAPLEDAMIITRKDGLDETFGFDLESADLIKYLGGVHV
jgi:nitrite reductase/ring-hydroxylating ferredoxin subunit